MKKKLILLTLMFASGCDMDPVFAQQPEPTQTPAQVEIQKRGELLQTEEELLFEKLHGLSEFQDYIKVMRELQDLPQKYKAAAANPEASAPPLPASRHGHTNAPNTPNHPPDAKPPLSKQDH